MNPIRKAAACAALALATAVAATPAMAQAWPGKPITWIVPFAKKVTFRVSVALRAACAPPARARKAAVRTTSRAAVARSLAGLDPVTPPRREPTSTASG